MPDLSPLLIQPSSDEESLFNDSRLSLFLAGCRCDGYKCLDGVDFGVATTSFASSLSETSDVSANVICFRCELLCLLFAAEEVGAVASAKIERTEE